MKIDNFNKLVDDILNSGNVEGVKLENIDTLKYVISDENIDKELYDGYMKNYKDMYGTSKDYHFMKLQDMIYRLHLLVKYNFIEKFGINDDNLIKDAISNILKNDSIDLYDSVSYDDSDFEIIDEQALDVRDALLIKNI